MSTGTFRQLPGPHWLAPGFPYEFSDMTLATLVQLIPVVVVSLPSGIPTAMIMTTVNTLQICCNPETQ